MTTERQFEVLHVFLDREEKRLPSPTYKDLAKRLGWQCLSSSRDYIRALSKQKLIEKVSDEIVSRPWRLTEAGIKLAKAYRNRIQADSAKARER